jgi:hypothetical protein
MRKSTPLDGSSGGGEPPFWDVVSSLSLGSFAASSPHLPTFEPRASPGLTGQPLSVYTVHNPAA